METTLQVAATTAATKSATNAEQSLLNQARAVLERRGHVAGCRVDAVVIRGLTPAGSRFVVEIDQGEALRSTGMTLRGRIKMALAVAERPLKGVALAARAGADYNAHFRHVLADLREEGALSHLDGGYWLASRGEPAPQSVAS